MTDQSRMHLMVSHKQTHNVKISNAAYFSLALLQCLMSCILKCQPVDWNLHIAIKFFHIKLM